MRESVRGRQWAGALVTSTAMQSPLNLYPPSGPPPAPVPAKIGLGWSNVVVTACLPVFLGVSVARRYALPPVQSIAREIGGVLPAAVPRLDPAGLTLSVSVYRGLSIVDP